ncbi:unnamed protein product [Photorhabdus laumondii subsp. laumondii TTO1]|uniref:Photorhabdus luminescens subsp. laumondii TTO1 complete genome segment 13/17 n=1 Tax=Photorhabdus laumondii subsp. laumondii (strain DSM 15139 / CIP 105565 / TT01) TaxID=243265 RepID=Q7N117_PHOLL|nr:unnamed protein product [Photorhabdus laumondii subsp. laumondii TTO1]
MGCRCFCCGRHYSAIDTLIAVGTGALTQGKGTLFSTLVNTGGTYLGSKVKGEDPTTSMLGKAVSTVIGNKVVVSFLYRWNLSFFTWRCK